MKANEVMLGNWIKEPIQSGGKIGQVKRIETDKDGYSHYLDHCSPIPLTEEWLLKFGFLVSDFLIAKNGMALNDTMNGKYILPLHGSSGDISRIIVIEYVHSLQNLYFALTGEELTV